MNNNMDSIITRRQSREVKVGNVIIGGNNPIVVQSMTNTDTMDTMATVEQTMRMVEQGCQMVRITASDEKTANNLYNIKNELVKRGCDVPLVADIHFNPKAAEISASLVEKIRINPGNYVDRKWKEGFSDKDYEDILKRAQDNISPLIDISKKHNTAIRIGVNHGSISERIVYRYGNTPLAMAESAMEFLRMFNEMDFLNIVVSMKASNVKVMNQANLILVEKMKEVNMSLPLHLGVTEAGNGEDGRIKSICGIGSLLAQGIGDTIRVSLTEKPENEIPVAKLLANAFSDIYEGKEIEQDAVATREIADNARLLLEDKIDVDSFHLEDEELTKNILQATGKKVFKAEFIACPSCGRTKYDIQSALEKVKEKCFQLKGLKIAVMGCIVNGPGEMADADYGYIGCGNGKVNLYRQGHLIHSSIEEENAINLLISMIKEDGKWVEQQ